MNPIVEKLLFTIIFIFALSTFANAQATRTWVAGVGDDVNPCSRTAPCKTFAGAISKTFSDGEITLDPGGFGTLTIAKSITVEGSSKFAVLSSGDTTNLNIAKVWLVSTTTFVKDSNGFTTTTVDRDSSGYRTTSITKYLHLNNKLTFIKYSSDGKPIITNYISDDTTDTFASVLAYSALSGFSDDVKSESSSLTARIEVQTVNESDGSQVQHQRIFYAPSLNPGRVRKYREPSSPSSEFLHVGAEFTFWAGKGDDPTPISDKVTITVQPKYNAPVKLQLKVAVASAP